MRWLLFAAALLVFGVDASTRVWRGVVHRNEWQTIPVDLSPALGMGSVVTFVVDVCNGDVMWRVEQQQADQSWTAVFASNSAALFDSRFDTMLRASLLNYRVAVSTTATVARAVAQLHVIDDRLRPLLPNAMPRSVWFDAPQSQIRGLSSLAGVSIQYCTFGRWVWPDDASQAFPSSCAAVEAVTAKDALGDCVTVTSETSPQQAAIQLPQPSAGTANMLWRIDVIASLQLATPSADENVVVVAALGPIVIHAQTPCDSSPTPVAAVVISVIVACAIVAALTVVIVQRKKMLARWHQR